VTLVTPNLLAIFGGTEQIDGFPLILADTFDLIFETIVV